MRDRSGKWFGDRVPHEEPTSVFPTDGSSTGPREGPWRKSERMSINERRMFLHVSPPLITVSVSLYGVLSKAFN